MNSTTIKDYLDLTKQTVTTAYNIGQMARYRYQYVLGKKLQKESPVQVNSLELAQNRDKMIKYAGLACLGAFGLLFLGIVGLTDRNK